MAYQVLNIDRRLLVESFVGEQNYFEFTLLGNWKLVEVPLAICGSVFVTYFNWLELHTRADTSDLFYTHGVGCIV